MLLGSYVYKYMELANMMNLKNVESYKPKAIALCYPVITLTQNTHLHTKFNITNGNPSLINELSIELHVTKDYPPTFIWTTLEDTAVDPISTELMDEALNKANVKNYYTCNNCHCYTYKPNTRENVYICKIVNYIMSVN